MGRAYDRMDVLVAACLAVGVSVWAFLWAQPYPHPDLWPFLAALKGKVSVSLLGVAGRLGLGAFAALVYLMARASWMLHRDPNDDLPDAFFFTRFMPLCASVALVCLPYVWRSAQFLTPGFALGFLLLFAVWQWQFSRLYNGLVSCFLAYLLMAFVAGINPLGLPILVYVSISDVVRRWQENADHGQGEMDLLAFKHRSTETALSLVAGVMGVAAAVVVGAVYYSRLIPSGVAAIGLAWWGGWFKTFWPAVKSELFIVLAVAVLVVVAAQALGRRIRATGVQGLGMSAFMACLLAVVALLTALRAVDLPERRRLAMLGEFVRSTVEDAGGAKWLFTDGRFDDALRVELKRIGRDTIVLDALNAPSVKKAAELRGYAPEPGDRDMFKAGGAEVFKAWARERPDRLADSAWQFGSGIVQRFGKTKQRTCGTVFRSVKDDEDAVFKERDKAFSRFTEELFALLERPVTHGIPFGDVDSALSAKCDAMVWRAARQAGERAEAFAEAGDVKEAQDLRQMMQKLDTCNASLRSQGNMLERLLPTVNLVLTPRESLDIALKRADFFLAQRYANEVLVSTPDDPSAHFALGMHGLEVKDFFTAARHFERVIEKQPDEPAALNNLSLAYLKLDQKDKALACAEHAARVNPKSAEVQKNLEAIKKAMKK